jgi:hypothetical protein
MLEFIICNLFVEFGGHIFQQIIGITIGVEHLMAKLKSPLLSQSQVKTFTIGVKEVNVKK